MKLNYLLLATGIVTFTTIGCNSSNNNSNEQENTPPASQETVYEAQLDPLNSNVTGMQTTGHARFVIAGDTMSVVIDVKNAPPGMQHWQHFHGFTNDSAAICASTVNDVNKDGIVDVVETEPVSGTTMVPFNGDPDKMQVGADSYPVPDASGSYHYEAKIPMDSLQSPYPV